MQLKIIKICLLHQVINNKYEDCQIIIIHIYY